MTGMTGPSGLDKALPVEAGAGSVILHFAHAIAQQMHKEVHTTAKNNTSNDTDTDGFQQKQR